MLFLFPLQIFYCIEYKSLSQIIWLHVIGFDCREKETKSAQLSLHLSKENPTLHVKMEDASLLKSFIHLYQKPK